MINLFRKKSTQETGQDISCIPEKSKKAKREYSFLLEFRCRGQLFATLESGSIENGIFRIGKNAQCDLVIPENDRICAGNHLELHFSSTTLRLQAVFGNYFYSNSRKNTATSLKLYDRISFGDCELNVKEGTDNEDVSVQRHRLEFTNGEKKGEFVFLDKELIKIGSDPENDLVLNEDVVSRFHARIRITENGECWLKDLQSINGTTVNDVKLDTQERMLMDSDEISFASVSLLFLDRRVYHTRSQIGRKFLIMGITIAVVAFFFALFYAVTPQASQLFISAEYYTTRGDFAAAQRMLDKMPNAKGYNNFKEHTRAFNEKLIRYRNTLKLWNEFKQNLQNSRWTRAIGNCGMFEDNNRSAWNWSEESAEQNLRELKHAKMLLDLYTDIQSLLYSSALTLEQKKEKVADLRKIKLPPMQDEISWLQPLRKKIAENTKKLHETVKVWNQTEKLLDRLDAKNCDIALITGDMEQLHSVAVGSVRTRIFGIINTLKLLQENDAAIKKNRKAIQEMRLNDIEKNIAFVSQDECLINRQLIRKRTQLIADHRKLLDIAGNIKLQYQKLCALGVNNGKLPESIESVLAENIQSAMIKNPDRIVGGVNLYDHFFGKRYFYWLMNKSAAAGENVYSDEFLSGLERKPLCVQLKNIFNAAETAHLYIQTLKNELPVKNNLAAFDKNCSHLLLRRNKLIRFYREKALQSKENGTYFIARAAVFYFSTPGSAEKSELKEFSEKWKKYQKEMQKLLRAYDPLDGKKMELFRQKIKGNGIPGDPGTTLLQSMP